MKNLLIVLGLVAIGYGFYRWLNSASADALAGAATSATSGQLERGKAAEDAAAAKVAEAKVNSVQEAVDGFHAQEGRWPSSLQELVDKKVLDEIPAGLTYDPATGKVSAG